MEFDFAFLQHILAHGVISIVFLIVGFSILKRKKNRVAQTVAIFFLIVGFGLGTCVILRMSSDPQISALGSYIGYGFVTVGLVCLLFFDLLIWKSQSNITIKKQLLYSSLYWIVLLPMIIPNNWAQIWIEYSDGSTIGNPVINLTYLIYAAVMGQAMIISTMVIAGIVAKKITHPELKKKFIQTHIGIILMDWILIGNQIFDFINNSTGRIIFLITGIVVVPGAILLYRGMVIPPLEQKKEP